MIFKLHYFLMNAGMNAVGILLGVYMKFYTNASPAEIGILYMMMPFIGIICRPIISSFADRKQAHKQYLMACLCSMVLCYSPFIVLPFMGPTVYRSHERFCWYFLVVFKVAGDVSYGCALTIGDSLTVNYCRRIKVELCYYRIFASISFMAFGVFIGQLNEVSFLPKYVAGFMVLVAASLIYIFALYLWPDEYFVMVTTSMIENENKLQSNRSPSSSWTRSLVPKEMVWSHAKHRLGALVSCSCCTDGGTQVITVSGAKSKQPRQVTKENSEFNQDKHGNKSIDKRTQLLTLLLLLRRDPRILGYVLTFAAAGAANMAVSFFFMSLSDICHTNNRCEFSQLAGFIQAAMSITEAIWLFCLKPVVRLIGRVNTLALAFGLVALKYLFYSTIWPSVSPNYSIVTEALHGIIFGTFIISINEQGHSFALEVEHLLPELVQRGIIRKDDLAIQEKLKLILPATMQGLIACSFDGIGRGFGSLAYGFIVGVYSFHILWLIVGFGSLFVCIALITINLLDHCMDCKLGLAESAQGGANKMPREDAEAQMAPTRDNNNNDRKRSASRL